MCSLCEFAKAAILPALNTGRNNYLPKMTLLRITRSPVEYPIDIDRPLDDMIKERKEKERKERAAKRKTSMEVVEENGKQPKIVASKRPRTTNRNVTACNKPLIAGRRRTRKRGRVESPVRCSEQPVNKYQRKG